MNDLGSIFQTIDETFIKFSNGGKIQSYTIFLTIFEFSWLENYPRKQDSYTWKYRTLSHRKLQDSVNIDRTLQKIIQGNREKKNAFQ